MRLERSVDLGIQPKDFSGACERYEFYALLIAGFETHGCAGGDVQTKTARRGAIKPQGLVHFEEMKVRADLNGTIAGV